MTVGTTVARSGAGVTVRIVLASVVGLLAVVLMPLAVPALLPTASAHDTLISSSPAAGESLEQAPEILELTYSDEVINLSPVVRLTTSAGEEVFTETPTVTGNTASIDLPPLPADSYTVQWRVVSSDGHPIEGTVDFTVTVGTEASGNTDTGSGEEEPTTDAPSAAATPADPAEAPRTERDERGLPLGMILGGLALLLVLALVAVVIVRRRGNSGPGTD